MLLRDKSCSRSRQVALGEVEGVQRKSDCVLQDHLTTNTEPDCLTVKQASSAAAESAEAS